MPHLKVAPFDTEAIDSVKSSIIKFRALSDSKEIVLISLNNKKFFLDIVKRDKEYLIKPNKITKLSDITLLKEALNIFAKDLNLNILQSNTTIKPTKPKIANEFFKTIDYFYDFKPDYKKIKLEVGFGSGRHLLHRAKEETDTLFIGVEIHSASINQLLKQLNLQNIKNVIVVNYDARLLLEMLSSNILDKIYVHFPVPWDKKPHRRVISDHFVNEALRVLKKGGELELRTDSKKYFEYSLEIFSKPKQSKFLVEKNIDIEIKSKYEERWRRMNKDIYTLTLESLEESEKREINIDFSFDISNKDVNIPTNIFQFEDYFVHFGKKYIKSDNSGFVVECSFGAFNMPEKKMIVVDDSSYYIPTNPVKSLANAKAHKIIKEVLNG